MSLEMISTIPNRMLKAGAIIFWLLVWEVASLLIGEELFLPSPAGVLIRLAEIIWLPGFWSSIAFTLVRIMLGFLLSVTVAMALAVLSYLSRPAELLIEPLVKVVRATPVASIVILTLVWISSRNLSVIISFMMVFPIVYSNVLEGIRNTDHDLLEAAEVYRIRTIKRIRYIYVPSVLPYFSAAVKAALGLAWKSGIAAEVIALPDGSIGERVYEAKIYLSTPDLFAWTLVIIILAFLFERFFLLLTKLLSRRIEG